MKTIIILLLLLPLVGALMGYLLGKKLPKIREYFFSGIVGLEMILMVISLIYYFANNQLETILKINNFCYFGLEFKLDGFRIIYALVSIFLWLMTILFSKEYMKEYEHKDRYYLFYLLTLCGVVGVFISNNLFTTFIFFEMMSLCSYPLVIHDEKDKSMQAGNIYLSITIITGMVLLMGLMMINHQINSLSFEDIYAYVQTNGVDNYLLWAGILCLFGFGAKAGMYPLHVWLPKAHPVAPAPASALLSGILTKTGVYGILVISALIFKGNQTFSNLILIFGTITMLWGGILGLLSTDIKRTLACSSMSQIGFILIGVAMYILLEESSATILGTFLYMINHSLLKLVLFMASGVIAMNLHALDLNTIRGYGRKKPFLLVIFLIASLGLMAIPLFSNYPSKTLIHEGIVEMYEITNNAIYKVCEWLFLASGGLTIAYMSKLFINIFVLKNNDPSLQEKYDQKTPYISLLTKIVFIISIIPIILIGILPNLVGINLVNNGASFFKVATITSRIKFFSWTNLKGSLISIGFGIAFYFLIEKLILRKNNKERDIYPAQLDLVYLYHFIIYVLPLMFTKYVLKFFAIIFDYLIYLLSISIFKPIAYQYKEVSLSYRIGKVIDDIKYPNDNEHYYAKKLDAYASTLKDSLSFRISTFSYALGMICIGLIVIFIFVFLFK